MGEAEIQAGSEPVRRRGLRPWGTLVGVLAIGAFALVALLPRLELVRREEALRRATSAGASVPALNPAYSPALKAFWGRSPALGAKVGIQAGHWKQAEVPAELGRLRDATGAVSGRFREVDINFAIAAELAAILASAGAEVEVLPATVPPGYLADAFVSIHADGANRPTARGWKMSAPWRASSASGMLLESVARDYGRMTGLPEDRYGVTYGMKGYYAFSPQRVHHSLSPFTPCILVETGFVTVASDRAVIAERPGLVARAIATGVLRYLADRPRARTSEGRLAYVPPSYPLALVTAERSELRSYPDDDEHLVRLLDRGTMVLPMQLRGEWAEVVVRGNFRSFGWVRRAELGPIG